MNVRLVLTDEQVEAIVDAVLERLKDELAASSGTSQYMTVAETAEYLRCSRQRVDDLLSARHLTRVKEGRRTLIARADVDAYLKRQERR